MAFADHPSAEMNFTCASGTGIAAKMLNLQEEFRQKIKSIYGAKDLKTGLPSLDGD
jgi:hypothetical protein